VATLKGLTAAQFVPARDLRTTATLGTP
jgi:hypothetical protein